MDQDDERGEMMSDFYRLSIDARNEVDINIYNEVRAEKYGNYSKRFPDRRAVIDEAVKKGYQLEVSE